MKTLLLTLDFIHDIVHPNGKVARSAPYIAEHNVITHANQAITQARKAGHLIAHVKVGFSPSYVECPRQSPVFGKAPEFGALQLGTWGTEFHEDLAIEPTDKVIVKHRVSALYNTDLETMLRANQIEQVRLCGVATNMAVETTARELHDRDYQVEILADACGTVNREMHEAALASLARVAVIS